MIKEKDFYKIERLTKREYSLYDELIQFIKDNVKFPIQYIKSSLSEEIVKKKVNKKDKISLTERYIVGQILFEKINNKTYDIIFGIDCDEDNLQYTLWRNDRYVKRTDTDNIALEIYRVMDRLIK